MTALEVSLMAGVIRAREDGFEATACALEDVFFSLRAEQTADLADEAELVDARGHFLAHSIVH